MGAYTSTLHRFRWLIVALFVICSTLSVWKLPRVKYDFSLGPLLEASTAKRESVRSFTKELPPLKPNVMLLVSWDHPIGTDELRRLRDWQAGIQALKDVRSIRSMINVPVIDSVPRLPIPRQILELSETQPLSEIVERHPLLAGRFISYDMKTAALLVDLHSKGGGLQRFEAHVAQAIDRPYRMVGTPFIETDLRHHMKQDMVRSIAFEGLVFLLLMGLYFRDFRGCLAPSLVLFAAVSLHFGLTYLMDWRITLLATAIPGLIIIIAMSDALHLLHNFEENVSAGMSRLDAVSLMLKKVAVACFYTSLSTAVGFLSLTVSDHQGIREFAVSASAGIAIAFVCVIVFLPALLMVWPRGKIRSFPVVHLPVVRYGRPRLTLLAFAALILLAIVGASRISVDTHVLEELDERSAVVQDFAFYETHFQGLLNLEVHLRGDFRSVAAFRAIDALQKRVAEAPDVNGSESYVDWLREIVNAPDEISDPQILRAVGFLSAAGEHFPRHVINAGFDQGRIRFYLRGAGTRRFLEFKQIIESESARLPPGLSAEVSGYAEMAHESTRLVVVTMLQSLILTLLVITIMLSLMYRSWHLGLLAILPNSLPILVALGVTGWLGIHLRIGIVMIYSVGIGLAVDDTIHMLSRYRSEKLRTPQLSPRQHLQETLRTTGTALILTSIILVAGALCYLPATLQSMRDVGLLLSAIVLTALFSDLYLLPLLVEHAHRSGKGSS